MLSFDYVDSITDLHEDEICSVFGGLIANSDDRSRVPPGYCPEGFKVVDLSYNGKGELTGYKCVPNDTTTTVVKKGSDAAGSVVHVVKEGVDWLASWFE